MARNARLKEIMEEKKSARRQIVLSLVLSLVVLGSLVASLLLWQPLGESNLLACVVSLACGAYAIVSSERSFERENWRCLWISVALLVLCIAVFWIAMQIPFCPDCDDGIDSPLMRWIFEKWIL